MIKSVLHVISSNEVVASANFNWILMLKRKVKNRVTWQQMFSIVGSWTIFNRYHFKEINMLFIYQFGAKSYYSISFSSCSWFASVGYELKSKEKQNLGNWIVILHSEQLFIDFLNKKLIHWWNQLTSQDSPYKNLRKCRQTTKVLLKFVIILLNMNLSITL